MIIDDALDATGEPLRTTLRAQGDLLVLEVTGRAAVGLPARVVVAVLERYGRPLEDPPLVLEQLELSDGRWVGRMRFHAVVDAEARDYVVLGRPGSEPIAAIAATVAAALRFLASQLDQ